MLSGPGYARCRVRLTAAAEGITTNSPETQGFQAVSAWRAREEFEPPTGGLEIRFAFNTTGLFRAPLTVN